MKTGFAIYIPDNMIFNAKGAVYEVAVYCTIKNTKRVFRIYPKVSAQ